MRGPTIIIGLALALAGCQTQVQTVTRTEHVVVQVPESMYRCPITRLPETKGLTDRQVAKLIANLYYDNMTCRQAMEAIKRYLADASRKVEAGQ